MIMKFSFREQKINFTMVLFLSPLFATTLLSKPVLAQQTSQSDKFVATINYLNISNGVISLPPSVSLSFPPLQNSFDSFEKAYQWADVEIIKLKQIRFNFFVRGSVTNTRTGVSTDVSTGKSLKLAQGKDYKLVKSFQQISENIDTFTKDFEQVAVADVLSTLISPNKQVNITEINNLTKAVNNLRKSTYIVGEDMKNISKQVSSEEDLIAVKDMVKSIETATLLLENLTPQLNQIRLAISTSD